MAACVAVCARFQRAAVNGAAESSIRQEGVKRSLFTASSFEGNRDERLILTRVGRGRCMARLVSTVAHLVIVIERVVFAPYQIISALL